MFNSDSTKVSTEGKNSMLVTVVSSETSLKGCHLVKFRAGTVKKTPCWYVRSWTSAHSYHFQVWRVKYSLALIQDFLERRLETQYVFLK